MVAAETIRGGLTWVHYCGEREGERFPAALLLPIRTQPEYEPDVVAMFAVAHRSLMNRDVDCHRDSRDDCSIPILPCEEE